jgi:hypothetical protein
MISEPDVTLTDYGLAIECGVLMFLLLQQGDPHEPLRMWFVVFFAAVGLAALTGGTVHGFFNDEATRGHAILWPTTLIAIGLSAVAGWAIAARVLFAPGAALAILLVAVVGFVGYSLAVVFISRSFALAVIHYVPAAIFLTLAFGAEYLRHQVPQLLIGLAGMVLTFVAAGLRQARVALHPVYFTHNALYHLVQAVALLMIFQGARWFVVGQ